MNLETYELIDLQTYGHTEIYNHVTSSYPTINQHISEPYVLRSQADHKSTRPIFHEKQDSAMILSNQPPEQSS